MTAPSKSECLLCGLGWNPAAYIFQPISPKDLTQKRPHRIPTWAKVKMPQNRIQMHFPLANSYGYCNLENHVKATFKVCDQRPCYHIPMVHVKSLYLKWMLTTSGNSFANFSGPLKQIIMWTWGLLLQCRLDGILTYFFSTCRTVFKWLYVSYST